MKPVPCVGTAMRRATFADGPTYDDVTPAGAPAVAFQVRPAVADCNPRVPQSSLPGGMLVGMLDGSVHFTGAGVAPAVFWASVTPAGGEVTSLD